MSFSWWKGLDQKTKQKIFNGVKVGSAISLGIAAYYYYYKLEKSSCCNCDNNNNDINISNNYKIEKKDLEEEEEEEENRKNISNIKDIVNDRYSETVRTFDSSKQQKSADLMAMNFGYTQEELDEFGGDGSNMGLACGNPAAQASIKLNETIVDLGCGGGFDCFIASRKVGNNGKIIGIDMSKDMINKAKQNAQRKNITNCEFHLSEIEDMPLKDNSVDCVISNCVLNLVPNKDNAFREIYRIVKPNGGRLAISDIALKKQLPKQFHDDMMAYIAGYISCVSGAILKDEYESKLKKAGFKQVQFVLKKADLNVWKESWNSVLDSKIDGTSTATAGCCGPPPTEQSGGCCGGGSTKSSNNNGRGDVSQGMVGITFTKEQREGMKNIVNDINVNEYIGSYYIFAIK